MNWYYRMLLSYTPILFAVVSSVIFIFFAVLNNASEDRYMATNRTIVEQMMRTTDASLNLIERNVVNELIKDQELRDYFSDSPKSVYDYYRIQRSVIDLQSLFPFVNSIYLYKQNEERVLADSGAYPFSLFADRNFLEAATRSEPGSSWTNPRPYALSVYDRNPQKVVSLVKYYPTASLKQGVIVVNLYADSIVEFLNRFDESRSGSVRLIDSSDQPFQAAGEGTVSSDLYARSDYTGWYYYAVGVNAKQFSALLFLSNVWVIIVLSIIAIALVGFTIITHMHYKPIQAIIQKVGGYMSRKGGQIGLKASDNEFDFIETALDHLLQLSSDYDLLHREDGLLRRQRLFHDLLAGHITLHPAEWERQMNRLGLPHGYEQLGVAALEIDRYAEFSRKYKAGDQHLLKFILESAFLELVQQRNMFAWHAWMEPRQLVVVVHIPSGDMHSNLMMRELCEEFRSWIGKHLEITVSAGIGGAADTIQSIAAVCRRAQDSVARKAAIGPNAIIDAVTIGALLSRTSGDNYYFPEVHELALSFRIDGRLWRGKLGRILADMRDTVITRHNAALFALHLADHLERELGTTYPELMLHWQEHFHRRLVDISEEIETVDELEERVTDVLELLEKELEREREGRKNHSIAIRVKHYLDEHYADPDLSLLHVSDQFGLQSTALSHLFKNEIGIKFIDYILKLRLDHAKRLLIESDEPIQLIAEKVGYSHVISFHRAFKKGFALPPGEYRMLHRPVR